MGSIRAALMVSAVSFGTASAASGSPAPDFDLQAHRGGLGLMVESTIDSFSKGLSVGVTTLEMDVQITKDHVAVITHDRKVDPAKCSGKYVGRFIKDLTLAQVETLDCGSKTLPQYPRQQAAPGAKMPTLRSVLNLVRERGGGATRMNIETKVEAGAPSETAPREEFVRVVAEEIRRAGLVRQVTIESFDWGSLKLMRQIAPELPLVALSSPAFSADPTASNPWLGGIALDDFGGDVVAAAQSIGASAISPQYGDPQDGKIGDPGFELLVTPEYVAHAHDLGLKVIPWTVDDKATMAELVESGVDGIITDYPDVLREVLAERGMPLPQPR
ncbi:MAG: glycerophosphodiester phosphodiesterase family protein [Segniliparus sp.]|uniref:glycerophosphodiester phosphodiesterase family protein n=1 Tax=Segniliparus sp. TaxID=2804064 RepID=UPI003F40F2DF